MMIRESRRTKTILMAACAALAIVPASAQAQGQPQQVSFNIPAQDLGTALTELARQSNREIVFPADLARGKRAPKLSGKMTFERALGRLLDGSGLTYRINTSGRIVIELAGREGNGDGTETTEADERGKAEILVVGSRSQNVDIKRTEDDPQPYVVFGKEEIERSNASSVEDFLRSRLPMNGQVSSTGQAASGLGDITRGAPGNNSSSLNLRGIGANQTLVLIDGRRVPRLQLSGQEFVQGDINGLPLSSIERIEVLPATAGGIYGGGAVGGVINIVRSRNYKGVDLTLGFDGTFRGGGERVRADLSGGFSLENGKTNISFALSRANSQPLYVADNNLWLRGRNLYLKNVPITQVFSGATPNIIAQSNLTLDNGTPLNSNRTFIPAGYSGTQSDAGAAVVANSGLLNTAFPNDIFGNRAELLNNPRTTFASVNVNRHFGAHVEIYLDGYYSQNLGRSSYFGGSNIFGVPADAPGNPFQQRISISLPLVGVEGDASTNSETATVTSGAIVRLGSGWAINPEFSWSRAKSTSRATALIDYDALDAAISSGALNIFRDTSAFPIDFTPYRRTQSELSQGPFETIQKLSSLRATGPLINLPGGKLNMTALIEHKDEIARPAMFNSLTSGVPSGEVFVYLPRKSQSNNSIYLELFAPIISPEMGVPFVSKLELQGSVRHDRYRTVAPNPQNAVLLALTDPLPTFVNSQSEVRSTDFTVAAQWGPSADITFRSSYSTGFLPPSISQIVQAPPGSSTRLGNLDPLRGNQQLRASGVRVTLIGGGNPALQPELSKSLSLGLILTPRFLPGFRLSADYTSIRKSGEFASPGIDDMLAHPEDYPGRVVRAQSNLPNDPAGFAPPVTQLDTSLFNISKASVKAYDFQASYDFENDDLGRFNLYSVFTLQTELKRQALPSSIAYDLVDYANGPLRWRGNVGLDWRKGNLRASANGQCYDSYSIRRGTDPLSTTSATRVSTQGAERIPSQFYVDVSIAYDFGTHRSALLSNLIVSAGIQNLFDTMPPTVAALTGGYSLYGDPRLRRFSLTLRKGVRF